MNLARYNDDALDELAEKITEGVKSLDFYTKGEVLQAIVYVLDEFDGDDTFGTEGWEHNFGCD